MKLKALLILFFAFTAFAQDAKQNLIEETNLHFFLGGEPSPQEVGFDNPKSYWKVKYELYLTDFSELEKLGICRRDEINRHICMPIRNNKLDKPIKKKSLKISKGFFEKKSLLEQSKTEVLVPINLPPSIIEIFNQATRIPERNPTFVLFVTQKISVKTATNVKLKEKISSKGFKQLKTAVSNRTFEYWDVKNLSIEITISKLENGQLRLSRSSVY